MDVTQNFKYVYTGGRDGYIYEVDILNEKYSVIQKGGSPVTNLKIDEKNGKIWYGTPDSEVKCIPIKRMQNSHGSGIGVSKS